MLASRFFLRVCLTLALGTASLGASWSVWAQDSKEAESQKLLASLRTLRYAGEVPSIKGFSPAQPMGGVAAPAGDHGNSQAYKSATGCVAFFLPPSDTLSGVAFKWSGAKCNGKLLEGKGELQVLRLFAAPTGTQTIVTVFRGQFTNGMLTGEGEKGNFSFTSAGKLIEDTFLFSGRFENSVLNGPGVRRWSGAATDQPSAAVAEGTFKDGVPTGGIYVGRLHPLPGVEADFVPLHYSPRGNHYIEQAQVNGGKLMQGTVFFFNDPVAWKMEVAVWRGFMEAGSFTRAQEGTLPFYAICGKWDFVPGKLTCDDGNAIGALKNTFFAVSRKPFSVPLPFDASAAAFNVAPGEKVSIASLGDAKSQLTCNENLTRCNGRLLMPVAASLDYWWLEADVRDGVFHPLSGKMFARASKDSEGDEASSDTEFLPESDRLLASCSSFSTPLVCRRGVVHYRNGAKAVGGWRFEGIDFERARHAGWVTYVARHQYSFKLDGEVHHTFANGSWADTTMEDGEIVAVGSCDEPGRGATFSCSLSGSNIKFTRRGESQSTTTRFAAPEPVQQPRTTAPAYKPIVMPSRPVYILPGMR